jgi:hypothetical protein
VGDVYGEKYKGEPIRLLFNGIDHYKAILPPLKGDSGGTGFFRVKEINNDGKCLLRSIATGEKGHDLGGNEETVVGNLMYKLDQFFDSEEAEAKKIKNNLRAAFDNREKNTKES